jgi:hypothetical protein
VRVFLIVPVFFLVLVCCVASYTLFEKYLGVLGVVIFWALLVIGGIAAVIRVIEKTREWWHTDVKGEE